VTFPVRVVVVVVPLSSSCRCRRRAVVVVVSLSSSCYYRRRVVVVLSTSFLQVLLQEIDPQNLAHSLL
jgi:hypothetical protein